MTTVTIVQMFWKQQLCESCHQVHSFASRMSPVAETPTPSRSPLAQNVNNPKSSAAVHPLFTAPGLLLVFGVGDTGQLGLGPDITERGRPCRHSQAHLESLNLTESQSESFFTQVCAGGMHTVGLTVTGRVVTCGCNDEGALGRKTSSDSDSVSELCPPLAKKPHVDPNENAEPDESTITVEESRLGFVPLPHDIKITMVSDPLNLVAEGFSHLLSVFCNNR